MNILILSAGTRNKVVRYFKKNMLLGKVVATDCSALAPAIYEADKYYIVSRMTEKGYIDEILDICRKEKIHGVLSLIDPELSLLSEQREAFKKLGVTVIGSDFSQVEMCFDKYRMFSFLSENGFKTAKSYIDKEDFYKDLEKGAISFPVFVKPIRGSASLNIQKVSSKEEVELLFSLADDLMIQEFMNGEEYGADCYIDMVSGKLVSLFVKKKLKMRAGETDKAVSFKDEKLFCLIADFVSKAGFSGVVDIDIFKIGDDYYISEVNPRFGGGYPHAYECSVNFPRLILRNLKGKENPENIGSYKENICMMKYSETLIKKM